MQISTSLGIPDFRSKDTGLYSKLEHLGLSDPQEVFDIQVFREDPSIFFSIAKDILPTEKKYSPTHGFIRLLQDKGKLLTNYTQNIDNIEGNAGVLAKNMVQCHGSFATATCVKCQFKVNGDAIFDEIKEGKIPECSACKERIAEEALQPQGLKRKRSSNGQQKDRKVDDSSDEDDYEIPTPGVMKVGTRLCKPTIPILRTDLLSSPTSPSLAKIFPMSSASVSFTMIGNWRIWSS